MGDAEPVRRGESEEPLVPAGGRFTGLVVLRRPSRIDGTVVGTVLAERAIWLGPESRIRGEVDAGHIVVGGGVEGRIRADGRVELLSTAVVNADVEASRVLFEEGCQLDGACRTRPGRAGGSGGE